MCNGGVIWAGELEYDFIFSHNFKPGLIIHV